MTDKEKAKVHLEKLKQCMFGAKFLPLSVFEVDALVREIDAALSEEPEPKKKGKK